MILAAYSEALVLEVRAILPLDMEAALSASPNSVAQCLTDTGIRLPVRSAVEALRMVVDADNHTILVLVPSGSATVDIDRAEAIAAAINAGCAVPAPNLVDRFDPHHLAAVKAESQRNGGRLNLPQAAE